MPRTTQRAPLNLSDKERKDLETLSTSRKAPLREVQRAKILLAYAEVDRDRGSPFELFPSHTTTASGSAPGGSRS